MVGLRWAKQVAILAGNARGHRMGKYFTTVSRGVAVGKCLACNEFVQISVEDRAGAVVAVIPRMGKCSARRKKLFAEAVKKPDGNQP